MPTYKNTSLSDSFFVDNINGDKVKVFPGAIIETYKLNLPSFMSKISDEPYLPLTRINQNVTSPGNITGLLSSKIIRLMTSDAGITVGANSSSNISVMTLPVDTPIDIENDGEIESLFFLGSGTVAVIGI